MRATESFELSDTEAYLLVLNGTYRAFPQGFWEGATGIHTAHKVLKFVFERIMSWSIEDIKTKATRSFFEEYKLLGMLATVFDGSIYIAIGEVYPELKEWADELYQSKEYYESDHRRYTDSELIFILQNKAKELNRVPKGRDMTSPCYMVYSRRFNSWEKALMKAGLIEDIYSSVDFDKYTKEYVLWKLKQEAINKERMLEKDEVFELYPEGLIKEFFGSYQTIKRVMENDYSKEELVKIFMDKKEQIGRIPTNKDMKFPQAIVFIDKFGSWKKLLDEVGVRAT